MGMTRKDYRAIADIINEHINVGDEPTINSNMFIYALAEKLSESNPNFDRLKFFEAASARQLDWKIAQRKQRESTLSWSEIYYPGLTPEKHGINNSWMRDALESLKDDGMLFVPNIGKAFNKQGEEINMSDIHSLGESYGN